MNILGTKVIDKHDKLTSYNTYMGELLVDVNGIFWYFVIPFGTLVWLVESYQIKQYKKKYPEEFV